ncbi:hypothetical protein SAMN04490194_4211 [Pseudomonas migulae]|uniref:Uncharacterized protein n=1 Tax=Pseudomonas migulae TaxID=78543 RepID=A0A1H5LUD4_9PSED|nr:hypothetical protein SAMN04490194_4211 [Pseudomonas migulae]
MLAIAAGQPEYSSPDSPLSPASRLLQIGVIIKYRGGGAPDYSEVVRTSPSWNRVRAHGQWNAWQPSGIDARTLMYFSSAHSVGAGLLAMASQAPRCSRRNAFPFTTIAGKPAPTGSCVLRNNDVFRALPSGIGARTLMYFSSAHSVGAGLLAMASQAPRYSCESTFSFTTIAGKPAPTGSCVLRNNDVLRALPSGIGARTLMYFSSRALCRSRLAGDGSTGAALFL